MTNEPTADPLANYALGLYWGIKQSFVQYVSRMSDGRIWVGDGACASPQGELLFAPESDAVSGEQDEVRLLKFTGAIQFAGHFGMLRLELRDPWVELRGEHGDLTVRAGGGPEDRVPLVSFELEQHAVNELGLETFVARPPRLSKQGVLLFNEVYSEGEEFEPLMIAVRAAGTAAAL